MQQNVIEKFNEWNMDAEDDFRNAGAAGFPWLWFANRARAKLTASGFLSERGAILFEPRYIETADAVLDGFLGASGSVGSVNIRATKSAPWERKDPEQWRQLLLAFSAFMFDAGVIAALTLGHEPDFDPVRANPPLAIFGDVGFTGLRGKMSAFLKEKFGDDAVNLVAEVADCCLAHLYADENLENAVFNRSIGERKAYFRGVSKAAYIAGATFVKTLEG